MRKYLLIICISILAASSSQAQVSIGVGGRMGYGYGMGRVGMGYGRPYPSQRRRNQNEPKFDPVIHFSIGYGYPNLDGSQLASFYNYGRGTLSQTGPVTASLDYQYSRSSSVGLMVTHGQVSADYYDYNNPSGPPVLNGKLDNWSVMVNFVNYIPTTGKIEPYFRTAGGLNIWNQQYTDASGNKQNLVGDQNQLAYQLGLGARFPLSKNTGFFLEAGYGKYILHGGLSFKL